MIKLKNNKIEALFNDLKDNIEFDSDVLAINIIIKKMLKINQNIALSWWVYILNNYELNSKDINFKSILFDIPYELLKINLINDLFIIRDNLTTQKRIILDNYLLNIYSDSVIKKIIEYYIIKNKFLLEKRLISKIITNKENINMEIFDFNDFVSLIISTHLKYNKLSNLNWLFSLIDLVNNKKEKAKIKVLLIDYI